jgi:hypothetical protein
MSEETKRVFDVRYTPQFVEDSCAGKKGKRSARPKLFGINNYKVTTKENETILGTYLVFGGVPPKAMHEGLVKAGFLVRRRPAESESKGKTFVVGERDNDCWTIYYNTEPTLDEDQIKVIGKLFTYFSKIRDTGKSGLLSTWEQVEEQYGSKDAWLGVITVAKEDKKATVPAVPASVEDGPDASLLDALFD